MEAYTGVSDSVIMYIEPNDLQGSIGHDNVPFNYEDYCIAVDLEVNIPNRYDCGQIDRFHFFSNDATQKISFLGGTDGMLTTSFTNISGNNGAENGNKETLGIKSIKIEYVSYYVPNVHIEFTDVKGTALMQPEEEGYADSLKKGETIMSQGSFFRALFTFPFPMFRLTVKGFYGKPITYNLAVSKFNTNFDDSTGNFDVSVDFIGYMYGIYTDIPFSYLLLAPYCEYIGSEYWAENATAKGKFNVDGFAMPKLIDLMAIIRGVNPNIERKLSSTKTAGSIAQNNAIINDLTMLLDSWNAYVSKIETSGTFKKVIDNNIFYAITEIKDRETYITLYNNFRNTLEEINARYTNLNLGVDIRLIKNIGEINELFTVYQYKEKNGYETKDDIATITNWAIEYPKDNAEEYSVIESAKGQVIRNAIGNNPEVRDIKLYIFNTHHTKYAISTYIGKLREINNALTEALNEEYDAEIEKILGFKPTAKNVVKIIFAHMETFMKMFYHTVNMVKNGQRTFQTLNIGANSTDVNANNASFIPPFPLIMSNNDSEVIYPEEYPTLSPDVMEELKLVNNLVDTAEGNFINTIINTNNFDFIHSLSTDRFLPCNPYKKISHGATNVMSDIITVFTNRLLTFLDLERGGLLANPSGRIKQKSKDEILNSFIYAEAYNIYKSNKWNTIVAGGVTSPVLASAAYSYVTKGKNNEIAESLNCDRERIYSKENPLYKIGDYTNNYLFDGENVKYQWMTEKSLLFYNTAAEARDIIRSEEFNSFDTSAYDNNNDKEIFLPFNEGLSETIKYCPQIFEIIKNNPLDWINNYSKEFKYVKEDIFKLGQQEIKKDAVLNYTDGIYTETSRFYDSGKNGTGYLTILEHSGATYNELLNNSIDIHNSATTANEAYKNETLTIENIAYIKDNDKKTGSLFGSAFYYCQTDERAKAMLFLQSLPLNQEYILKEYPKSYQTTIVPLPVVLLIGGLLELGQYSYNKLSIEINANIISDDVRDRILHLRYPVQKKFTRFFHDWVFAQGEFAECSYSWPNIKMGLELFPNITSDEFNTNFHILNKISNSLDDILKFEVVKDGTTGGDVTLYKVDLGDNQYETKYLSGKDEYEEINSNRNKKAFKIAQLYITFNNSVNFEDETVSMTGGVANLSYSTTTRGFNFTYSKKSTASNAVLKLLREVVLTIASSEVEIQQDTYKFFAITDLEKTEPTIINGYDITKMYHFIKDNEYGISEDELPEVASARTIPEEYHIPYYLNHNGNIVYYDENYDTVEISDTDSKKIKGLAAAIAKYSLATSAYKFEDGFVKVNKNGDIDTTKLRSIDIDVLQDYIKRGIKSHSVNGIAKQYYEKIKGNKFPGINELAFDTQFNLKDEIIVADDNESIVALCGTERSYGSGITITGTITKSQSENLVYIYSKEEKDLNIQNGTPSGTTFKTLVIKYTLANSDNVVDNTSYTTPESGWSETRTYFIINKEDFDKIDGCIKGCDELAKTKQNEIAELNKNLAIAIKNKDKEQETTIEEQIDELSEEVSTITNNSNTLSAVKTIICNIAKKNLGESIWIKPEYLRNGKAVNGFVCGVIREGKNSDKTAGSELATKQIFTADDVEKSIGQLVTTLALFFRNKNKIKTSKVSNEIKLSIYMHLKNLYDKWLCSIPEQKWDINFDKSEFKRFVFMDSYYNDISNSLMVNVENLGDKLLTIMSVNGVNDMESAPSLYSFIQGLSQDCGCMIIESPALGTFNTAKEYLKAFKPMPFCEMANEGKAEPAFLWIYSHEGSRNLSVEESQYSDDGFNVVDLNGNICFPKELCPNEPLYQIPAFGVSFGKENQSMFKGISINMDNAQMTDVAIANTLQIGDNFGKHPATSRYISQDLFRVYANKWYMVTVTMMGNVSISPLMYFQLNNIPMFRGTYRITKVSHDISVGTMTTTFTGVRMSANKMPLIKKILQISDILAHSNEKIDVKDEPDNNINIITNYYYSYDKFLYPVVNQAKEFSIITKAIDDSRYGGLGIVFNTSSVTAKNDNRNARKKNELIKDFEEAYSHLSDNAKRVFCAIAYSAMRQFGCKRHNIIQIDKPENLSYSSVGRRDNYQKCDRCYGRNSEHGDGKMNAEYSNSFLITINDSYDKKADLIWELYDMILNSYSNNISQLILIKNNTRYYIEVTVYDNISKSLTLGYLNYEKGTKRITLDSSDATTFSKQVGKAEDYTDAPDELRYLFTIANILKENKIAFFDNVIIGGEYLMEIEGEKKIYKPFVDINTQKQDMSVIEPFIKDYANVFIRK